MPDIDKLAKNLRKNQDYLEFQEYIIEKIEELNTVSNLGALSNKKAGEEAKVRLLSVLKLQEILSPFINFREKREYTKEDFKKAREKKGL